MICVLCRFLNYPLCLNQQTFVLLLFPYVLRYLYISDLNNFCYDGVRVCTCIRTVVNGSSFLLCLSTGMCHKCGQALHDFVSQSPWGIGGGWESSLTY